MKRIAQFAALLALALPASAATYYVKASGGDDNNTGLAEGKAFKTIQKAIDKAAAGSTILVYPGTYGTIATNNKKLTIRAVEGPDTTIIDGYYDYGEVGADLGAWGTQTSVATGRAVEFRNRSTGKKQTVKYYNISSSADHQVFEVSVPKGGVFRQNENSRPGMLSGILFPSAPPAWLTGTSIVYNDFGDWEYWTYDEAPRRTLGKYHFYSGGNATTLEGFKITGCHQALRAGNVVSCLVTDNEYDSGARDDLPGDDAMAYLSKLSDCTFENNDASSLIGGTWKAYPTATRCTFSRNTLSSGVATPYYGCSFFNCLFANNTMTEYGDLLNLDSSSSGNAAYNCTLAYNILNSGFAVSSTHLYNSIVWGNRTEDDAPANVDIQNLESGGSGGLRSNGKQYVYGYMNSDYDTAQYTMMNCDIEGIVVEQKGNKGKVWGKYGPPAQNSTGNISEDPCFVAAADGDYHLAPWSPCIDKGADYQSKTGKFDLDSAARKVAQVDMGAYELQPRMAVPADYDGDGVTDAAFYFGASAQWWIFKSSDGKIRTLSLPDAGAEPCPADYDVVGHAEPAYFTAAAKVPEFVRVKDDGSVVRQTFGEKGATPVAAHLAKNAKATFGTYTANAKQPEFSFLGTSTGKKTFGAKASRPVVADFDADGKDDLGVYAATASKPAFSILQSSRSYSTTALFNGGPVALGAKGAIPCCANFDGIGGADFGVYMSNTKEPYFQRLFSSSKFRETRTLPMGSKGDVPVVGVYEAGQPAVPAVWTGAVWTYVGSDWENKSLIGD